jgi:hypothetical protein
MGRKGEKFFSDPEIIPGIPAIGASREAISGSGEASAERPRSLSQQPNTVVIDMTKERNKTSTSISAPDLGDKEKKTQLILKYKRNLGKGMDKNIALYKLWYEMKERVSETEASNFYDNNFSERDKERISDIEKIFGLPPNKVLPKAGEKKGVIEESKEAAGAAAVAASGEEFPRTGVYHRTRECKAEDESKAELPPLNGDVRARINSSFVEIQDDKKTRSSGTISGWFSRKFAQLANYFKGESYSYRELPLEPDDIQTNLKEKQIEGGANTAAEISKTKIKQDNENDKINESNISGEDIPEKYLKNIRDLDVNKGTEQMREKKSKDYFFPECEYSLDEAIENLKQVLTEEVPKDNLREKQDYYLRVIYRIMDIEKLYNGEAKEAAAEFLKYIDNDEQYQNLFYAVVFKKLCTENVDNDFKKKVVEKKLTNSGIKIDELEAKQIKKLSTLESKDNSMDSLREIHFQRKYFEGLIPKIKEELLNKEGEKKLEQNRDKVTECCRKMEEEVEIMKKQEELLNLWRFDLDKGEIGFEGSKEDYEAWSSLSEHKTEIPGEVNTAINCEGSDGEQ